MSVNPISNHSNIQSTPGVNEKVGQEFNCIQSDTTWHIRGWQYHMRDILYRALQMTGSLVSQGVNERLIAVTLTL